MGDGSFDPPTQHHGNGNNAETRAVATGIDKVTHPAKKCRVRKIWVVDIRPRYWLQIAHVVECHQPCPAA